MDKAISMNYAVCPTFMKFAPYIVQTVQIILCLLRLIKSLMLLALAWYNNKELQQYKNYISKTNWQLLVILWKLVILLQWNICFQKVQSFGVFSWEKVTFFITILFILQVKCKSKMFLSRFLNEKLPVTCSNIVQ